ncbi:ABC transporter ATP-binding protein [Biostraticola tofi]|uniref:ABC-2 type transport system ATP-binding protein/lipopolysaccharide transport system ATP-binding protein n=1 Tax=Biostraticola tofi TaxID=466109 RepID=A0A4V2W3V4_9GAMM|nr:ABC transporter ATP-binding protein [Biostraticola tofi]TCV93529.1 ABC-2 type transport system ATP-binding protein/lipopolysaccharide transport system ATP-binding protein [Biostraticola tofi]
MATLIFENVTVTYPIYNAHSQSLRNQLVRIGTGGRIGGQTGTIVTITALNNISFALHSGDAVGLVGHNGAGKSTLLRTMAGIYAATAGNIQRSGSVATVFELGAGMDPELSGYENILRMLLLMGNSLADAKAKVPDIEDFSELGDFLVLPVRTYSSGMTMRLMFAVATSVRPDILLIDEMFGTGDDLFQKKAEARMQDWIAGSDIFVFASHDRSLIKRLCNRVLRLEHGDVYEDDIDRLP